MDFNIRGYRDYWIALVQELRNNLEVWGTCRKSEVNDDYFHSIRLSIGQIYRINKLIDEINPSYIISCLREDFEEQLVFHKVLVSYLKNTKLNLIF